MHTLENTGAPAVSGTGPLHPDDILLGLLVLGSTPPAERVFPTSSPRLHEIFDALRETPEGDELLDVFEVLSGAPYPYSPQLARSLAHLECSRLVGKYNPDFERFFVAADAREVFDRVVAPKLGADVRARLSALATRFWDRATAA